MPFSVRICQLVYELFRSVYIQFQVFVQTVPRLSFTASFASICLSSSFYISFSRHWCSLFHKPPEKTLFFFNLSSQFVCPPRCLFSFRSRTPFDTYSLFYRSIDVSFENCPLLFYLSMSVFFSVSFSCPLSQALLKLSSVFFRVVKFLYSNPLFLFGWSYCCILVFCIHNH